MHISLSMDEPASEKQAIDTSLFILAFTAQLTIILISSEYDEVYDIFALA